LQRRPQRITHLGFRDLQARSAAVAVSTLELQAAGLQLLLLLRRRWAADRRRGGRQAAAPPALWQLSVPMPSLLLNGR
jgi:hypothetical protein